MTNQPITTRRGFLAGTAGAIAHVSFPRMATAGASQPEAGRADRSTVKSVSSANGLGATARAYALLGRGADPLDAVIAGVNLVEDDPQDISVGYGGRVWTGFL